MVEGGIPMQPRLTLGTVVALGILTVGCVRPEPLSPARGALEDRELSASDQRLLERAFARVPL